MEISYMNLLAVVNLIAEENLITTIDGLCQYLTENPDLVVVVEEME